MSVQVSHVHGGAMGSGRTPLDIGELEVEGLGFSVTLTFLWVWVEGSEAVRGWGSDLDEGI